MKAAIGCLIGLTCGVSVSADSSIEGHVRRPLGSPVPGAQVRLFDLSDLRAAPLTATTDRSGRFNLPLATMAGALPERFELGANYPNPFNPSTMIPYQLPTAMHVRLEIYNLLGQRVVTLVDGDQPAGFHMASWDATDAAGLAVGAGVYLYRLRGDGVQATRRMLLIDGQAGIPSGGSGSSGLDDEAVSERAGLVYGLTVSSSGLVPYVKPTFRVETGLAPLSIVVEVPGSVSSAKVASSGSILGDVDNTGNVDFFDALLVALYSHDSSTVLPNDGDISLGDVNADGQVDLSDAWAIAAWLNDPSDPSLPAGIGQPREGATASLAPDPSTVTWVDDGAWHAFTVQAGEPVTVVANPAGTAALVEITTRSGRRNFCPAEADDDVSRTGGQTLYLSLCAEGEATVELRRASDGTVLNTYTFEVTGSPPDLIVESVSVSDSTLAPGQSFGLKAVVVNVGREAAEATTLHQYRSSNRTISTQDTEVGTDAVYALTQRSSHGIYIILTAPSSEGTYYYGACVASVEGERAGNNCSRGVRVVVDTAHDSPPVTFPDAHLRAAIAAKLGKAPGATITQDDMAALVILSLERNGTDLTGLEFAVNLGNLGLWGTSVSDLSPLADLTNLYWLRLAWNRISDLSPLSGLTELYGVFLQDNLISDISPLSGLTYLRYLELQGNFISDISALRGLGASSLRELDVRNQSLSDSSINHHIPFLQDRGVRVEFDPPLRESDFDIELVFLDDHFDEQEKGKIRYAARRWMSIIREDLPDHTVARKSRFYCGDQTYPYPIGERIDDLRIYVRRAAIPRGWGAAAPSLMREETHLPVFGCMEFQSGWGAKVSLVLHEMGHVLGIGAGPAWRGFLQDVEGDTPHFNGPQAVAAFDDAGGQHLLSLYREAGRPKAAVPVTEDGTHWDLSSEIMDAAINTAPLSAITIQALADLGYVVDVTQADSLSFSHYVSAKVAALPGDRLTRHQVPEPPYLSCGTGQHRIRFNAVGPAGASRPHHGPP